ncbi:hypothetical protein ZIOFF_071261 [Zingiber officinale]|uniref:Reverse transcriptase Ty1/copia-type domain-containing protein n=1 Tax=Zingiber officinale TaxID=94328 RepID=A0A8J5BE22_ZINOF|nr:hypothetical protein ZIOFF_071261 [Zingiber officinale]
MGSNPIMFGKFKEAMTKEFERTEIGLMAYYLSIEVNRREVGIFNSQEGYAREILKKFKMDNSKPINIPVEYGVKLSKHDKLEKVDPTLFKSLDSRYLQLKKLARQATKEELDPNTMNMQWGWGIQSLGLMMALVGSLLSILVGSFCMEASYSHHNAIPVFLEDIEEQSYILAGSRKKGELLGGVLTELLERWCFTHVQSLAVGESTVQWCCTTVRSLTMTTGIVLGWGLLWRCINVWSLTADQMRAFTRGRSKLHLVGQGDLLRTQALKTKELVNFHRERLMPTLAQDPVGSLADGLHEEESRPMEKTGKEVNHQEKIWAILLTDNQKISATMPLQHSERKGDCMKLDFDGIVMVEALKLCLAGCFMRRNLALC